MVIFTPWDRIRNKNRNKKNPRYPSAVPEAAFASKQPLDWLHESGVPPCKQGPAPITSYE